MGLDMYAYARPPRKRNSDEDVSICDWRKHNRLQGWMEDLWESTRVDQIGNHLKKRMILVVISIVLSCN
jgi:hypothetical protein